MKKTLIEHLSAIIAYAMIGTFGMGIWRFIFEHMGLAGGWFAGVLIIGIFWYMNHYIGLIQNRGAWVDVGLGLGMVGMMRDTFLFGFDALVGSLPTLFLVAVGAILGGVTAAVIDKYVLSSQCDNN